MLTARKMPQGVGIIGALVLIAPLAMAGQPVFTLDDNPGGPPAMVGYGAEDPFGLGIRGAPLAPSPSLAVVGPFGPFTDGDVLQPGPIPPGTPTLHVVPPDGLFVNALSDNTGDLGSVYVHFSVDRSSTGLAGTGVAAQTALNQQPADVFVSTAQFAAPGGFTGLAPLSGYVGALPTANVGGGNALVLDESALTLTAGLGVGNLIPSNVMAPPIGVATHDNVDGFEWRALDTGTAPQITDRWFYFSVNPDEVAALANQGVFVTPAEIFDVPPHAAAGANFAPFARAWQLGLQSQDDVDALVMWDRDVLGGTAHGGPGAQAAIDYALFSLGPGSASLGQPAFAGGPLLSEADVFFTDFSGSFALYALGSDLGLDNTGVTNPLLDNIDALEVDEQFNPIPEPSTLLIWSLLAVLGIGVGWRRRKR